MIRIIFTWLGTAASIIGLVFAAQPGALQHEGWLVTVSTVILLGALWDVWEHAKTRPKRFDSADTIKKYMNDWIHSGGRVVVFTRDMTWVDSEDMKGLLREKARAHELTICLP